MCGGGDWYDASMEVLIEPDGRNMEEDIKKYPGWKNCTLSKRDWLIKEFGYRDYTDDEAYEHWEI